MTSTRRGGPDRPRLNCFAFPSDVTSRFLLLVVATVGSALFLYSAMFFALPGENERAQRASSCAAQVRSSLPATNADQRLAGQRLGDCDRSLNRRQVLFATGSLGALSLVAAGIYLLTPRLKIHHRRLVRLTADDAPEVVACFERLCTEAGLARRPTLLWNPLNRGGGAVAFGRLGRYHVAVGAGLVTQYYLDPDAVMAVLRHELAHLVNRDVNTTYLTTSTWWAFVVAALVPFAVLQLTLVRRASHLTPVGAYLWRAVVLSALVYLIRNSALRSREYYADVRASLVDGPGGALPQVIDAMPKVSGWRQLTGLHPDPRRRRKVLGDTVGLSRLGVWDVLAAGAVAGVATSVFADFWTKVVVADLPIAVGGFDVPVAAVVVGSMLGAFLGIVVWRATFAARALDLPPPGLGAAGLALAAGLIAGASMSFDTAVGAANPFLPRVHAGSAAVALVTATLLTLWLRAVADAWLDAVPARGWSMTVSLGILTAAALWAWGLGWVWLSRLGLRQLSLRSAVSQSDDVAQHPLTILAAIALLVVPLAAVVSRRHRYDARTPEWAFLETSSQPAPWPDRARLRLGSAALWGAGAGLLFFLLILGLRATDLLSSDASLTRSLGLWELRPLLRAFPENAAVFTQGAGKVGYFRAQVGLALLLQVGLGVVVATRSRRAAEVHAVSASVAAGLVMAVGIVAVSVLHGGTWDRTYLWTVTKTVMSPGVFVAFAAAAVTAGIRGWSRAATDRRAHGPRPTQGRRLVDRTALASPPLA